MLKVALSVRTDVRNHFLILFELMTACLAIAYAIKHSFQKEYYILSTCRIDLPHTTDGPREMQAH
jgi:hypothetical protein